MKSCKLIASFWGMIVCSQISQNSYGMAKLLNTEGQWKLCICLSTVQYLTDFCNRVIWETDWRREPFKSTASGSSLSSHLSQSTALRVQSGYKVATCSCVQAGTLERNLSIQVLCSTQGMQTCALLKVETSMKQPFQIVNDRRTIGKVVKQTSRYDPKGYQ